MNTEGSRVAHGRGFARIVIYGTAKAADGTDVSSFETFEAVDESGLPDDKVILAAIDRVANDVSRLLKAPEAEPFVGPAIFSGRAAGVFFHEIFGHRVEGHRQKDESEGQTFTKSVGTKVLPDFLSRGLRPHAAQGRRASTSTAGTTTTTKASRRAPITAVDKGVLKTFLMSRSPIKGFDQSNGHGRRQPGLEVVSRQIEPDRGIHQRGSRGAAAPDADRRGQEAEQAVRPVLPRHHGRVHHHAARPACRRSR